MDLYELLGIARGATLVEIKRAYRRLARKYHPDINPGDNAAEARFREITRAYETLIDPERRLRYDAGALSVTSSSASFEFEGFDFSAASRTRKARRSAICLPKSSASARTRGRASRFAAPICTPRYR